MILKNQLVACVVFVSVLQFSTGLKCFSCSLTVQEGQENAADMTCVNDPAHVIGKSVITCPARMKFCTIVRNDIKSTGAVSSIERNCAENPVILNEDIESDELISHYRSCTTDLCNSGKGNEDPNWGNGDGGSGVGGMVVPGVSSAHLSALIAPIAFVLNIILTYYL